MKTLTNDNINRILVRSANWVGDAIMTTPALRAVRRNFAEAQISILAKPWVAPIFYHNPDIDRIILYDDAGRHRGWMGKPRLGRELRKHGFDLAVLFQNAFEAALLAFLARIPNRLGYTTDGRSLLLTHRIRRKPEYKLDHQIDYYLGILEGVSIRPDGRNLTLIITEQERQRAFESMTRFGTTDKDMIVGINPGAAYGTAKRWMPERYATLCRKLMETLGARIIIFGGPGEGELGKWISESLNHRCIDLCGKTSLREAAALIERCSLFITNDSGLMHVAAALDRPLIAIIGSTDHITTGPSNPTSRIVRAPMPCSPCLKPDCPEDHRCMKAITVDMVFDAALKLLREAGKGENMLWQSH